MYKRYYDSYGNGNCEKNSCEKPSCGEIIIPESVDCKCEEKKNDKCEIEPVCPAPCEPVCKESSGFLGLPFDTDDLILIGILLFLLFDRSKDDDNEGDNTFLYILIGIIILSEFLDDKN